ncbi:MAG: glycerol-3-phosphate dehydrogenase/oxidase [Microbacteriaceae bacterium]|nr:glycerol-3-phosphate dehydrogenase/oxidase [Microbacteriaceae bacterium]HOA86853.1 glycerol-3-phosphate dehydrogenase/oxidase [Microbacteriaceae bacterium]HPZ34318.1 glycerol-3-phosphate dehydrogenase/oxidase [Microbacteriaceae bacterium]HQC92320.1 glycerol-3-phosphate dehydrogenase/oxidase [Microbacteriaceae bacterium]
MTAGPVRRRRAFAELVERPSAQVLIIGGGINGVATMRDLAMQGVDVMLIERGDYASGASSASSHMIHGGIRYLENGEFRLVHESVTERNGLLQIAPHYVKPLKTTVPIFSTFSGVLSAPLRFLRHGAGRPRERGAALIKIGLVIYDSFSRGGGRLPRHEFLRRRRSLAKLPRLNPEIRYTATYYDASMQDPERLALDVLHDGLRAGRSPGAMGPGGAEMGSGALARAANYVEAFGVSGGGVRVRDAITGEEAVLTASVVVNASGPWTDLTNAALGRGTRFMGGTKGSHIVLDHPELLAATGGREIFFEHSDGRIVLIYPLNGRVLVGTTDLEHDMREPVTCTEEEVDYFFGLIRHVFPDIEVGRAQIVYRFAGVRPLPGHGDLAPGFVSRDYRIERATLSSTGTAQVLSLVGGKWTTFRALAEHLSDEVLGILRVRRATSTKGVAIGGGVGYPRTEKALRQWLAANSAGVGRERAARLLARYGTRASEVIAAIRADEGDRPIRDAAAYSTAELRHLAATEHVVHLDDLLRRRTNLVFTGDAGRDCVRDVAETIAEVCGWDADDIEREEAAVLAMLERQGRYRVEERATSRV